MSLAPCVCLREASLIKSLIKAFKELINLCTQQRGGVFLSLFLSLSYTQRSKEGCVLANLSHTLVIEYAFRLLTYSHAFAFKVRGYE